MRRSKSSPAKRRSGFRARRSTTQIHGHVLAFNAVAVESDELQEDASLVLPDVPLAVTRTLSGSFHGHLAHLGLSFEHRVEPDDVRDVLTQTEGIEIESLPISLDSVPDRDDVVVTPPSLSPDGTQLALTMMADGLRIGGALTAVEILERAALDHPPIRCLMLDLDIGDC